MTETWQDPATWTAPDADEIDVWLIELRYRDTHGNIITTPPSKAELSADECKRAERLIFAKNRAQFIIARTALRRILARYVDEVAFTYGEHGKPGLATPNAPAFNLSHSADHAILAVCPKGRLGADIEERKAERKCERLAQRFFATEESAQLMAKPEAERAYAFFRAWTCKEAYLKAWGTGLMFPSNGFVIDYTSAGEAQLLATDMPQDLDVRTWSFHDLPVPEAYAGTVCWQHGERSVRLWRNG